MFSVYINLRHNWGGVRINFFIPVSVSIACLLLSSKHFYLHSLIRDIFVPFPWSSDLPQICLVYLPFCFQVFIMMSMLPRILCCPKSSLRSCLVLPTSSGLIWNIHIFNESLDQDLTPPSQTAPPKKERGVDRWSWSSSGGTGETQGCLFRQEPHCLYLALDVYYKHYVKLLLKWQLPWISIFILLSVDE